jgi:hypothetical protein
MTDNKIQSATCRGRCGRCWLESHTRGKGCRRGGASMGLWLVRSRGCLSRLTPWSRRGVEICRNFRKLGMARM